MQNVTTPLPLGLHFAFCLFATLLFLVQYYRKGAAYYLPLIAAVDATFITQIYTSPVAVSALGILEIVLIVTCAVMAYRYSAAQKTLRADELKEAEEQAEKAKEIQKAQSDKDDHMVDNAFDDQ